MTQVKSYRTLQEKENDQIISQSLKLVFEISTGPYEHGEGKVAFVHHR